MSKKKIIFFSLLAILVIIALIGLRCRSFVFSPNTAIKESTFYLNIPTKSSYEDMLKLLKENGVLKDYESFERVCKIKRFNSNVKPGRYAIKQNMSNNDIINLLRNGNQTPVNLSFISLRSLDLLSGKVAKFIEADSISLNQYVKDPKIAEKYGFTEYDFMSMFIPNTYQFFWNTSAEKFVSRMNDEYTKFWNSERLEKAKNIGLSPVEVSILASIVEAETQKNDEKARIAGVYINRLKVNMLLQADPTVVFANGDFSIRRVLNKHLQKDSPYNTYLYSGLPPGPINIPSISSIDAVLGYETHKFIYFCAKDDLSGYHAFAQTLSEHNRNARKYHSALYKAGIK